MSRSTYTSCFYCYIDRELLHVLLDVKRIVDLLCEECVMTRGRLPGGGGSSVVGKRETRLYEPEASSSRGVKTGAFCSASRNASE
jgi:hypothetical protein